MAGRRTSGPRPVTFAQTPGVTDKALQRAFDVLNAAVHELQSKSVALFTADTSGTVPASGGSESDFLSADGTWKTLTGAGLVDSVTAGSSAVSVSPTVGAVVIDVVEANFSGIPESAITFSGTNNVLQKISGTSLVDSTVTDTGSLVTIASPLNVTGTADFDSSLLVNGTLTVNGAVDFDSTLDVDGAVNFDSTLTLSPMTSGSILFTGTGGLVSQDNTNLFWNDTLNHLCLNTAGSNSDNTAYAGGTVAQLEVSRDAAVTTIAASSFGSASHPQLYFIRGRGTRAAPTAVQSGDVLGYFTGAGYGDTVVNKFGGGAGVKFVADAVWTASSHPGAIVLDTVPTGATTSVDRVRVNQAGNIGIGLNTGVNPDYRLSVYSPGNTGAAAAVIKGAYYGTLIASEQTSSSYYLLNVSAGHTAGGASTWIDSGTSRFYVRADGNVGVGNSSPGFKLDVSGTLNATGAVTFGSTLGVTGNVTVNTNKFTVTASSGNTLVAGTLDSTGNFNVNTNKFSVVAASGNTTVAGTLGVTGLATLTAGFSLGADSSAASHKITNLTNGSSAQDAAAFGQIATAVNAAVSGTTNLIPKFTSANVIGNSSITDDGTTVSTSENAWFSYNVAGSMQLGYSNGNATNGQNNITLVPDSGGHAYFESKVGSGKFQLFTIGAGTSPAYNFQWLAVEGSTGKTTFNAAATISEATNAVLTLQSTSAISAPKTMGTVAFSALNSGGTQTVEAQIVGTQTDYSGGSQDGQIDLQIRSADTMTSVFLSTSNPTTSVITNTITGATTFTDNLAAGDATTDTFSVAGYAGIGTAPQSNTSLKIADARTYMLYADNTSTGAASDLIGLQGHVSGSANATAARTTYGVAGTSTATRSAGANNVTNVGVYAYASGGQVNRGLWVDAGTALIDESLTVGGAATFGSSSNEAFTVNSGSGNIFLDGGYIGLSIGTISKLTVASGAIALNDSTIIADTTSRTVGFYGSTGATQQTVTGSRGGNAALASLLTKLATLGIIVDGTSA